MQGLDDMLQSDRDDFFSQFDVPAADQQTFNSDHPAPVAPASPEPAKKRQKTVPKQLTPPPPPLPRLFSQL